MGYEIPRDDRFCQYFGVRSCSIFAAVWRGILGFNLFIFGAVLLHFDGHKTYTFTYALMARHTDVIEMLPGVPTFWAIGYLIGGMIEILLNISLLYVLVVNKISRKLLLTWSIISPVLCAFYFACIIYQIRLYEVKRMDTFFSHQPHSEFIFFALPFIGEVCHMYFIFVVRCLYSDSEKVAYKVFAMNAADRLPRSELE